MFSFDSVFFNFCVNLFWTLRLLWQFLRHLFLSLQLLRIIFHVFQFFSQRFFKFPGGPFSMKFLVHRMLAVGPWAPEPCPSGQQPHYNWKLFLRERTQNWQLPRGKSWTKGWQKGWRRWTKLGNSWCTSRRKSRRPDKAEGKVGQTVGVKNGPKFLARCIPHFFANFCSSHQLLSQLSLGPSTFEPTCFWALQLLV